MLKVDDFFQNGKACDISAFQPIAASKDNPVMEKYREERQLSNTICDYHLVKEPIIKIVFAENDEWTMLKLGELLNKHPLASAFSFVRSENTLYEIYKTTV